MTIRKLSDTELEVTEKEVITKERIERMRDHHQAQVDTFNEWLQTFK